MPAIENSRRRSLPCLPGRAELGKGLYILGGEYDKQKSLCSSVSSVVKIESINEILRTGA